MDDTQPTAPLPPAAYEQTYQPATPAPVEGKPRRTAFVVAVLTGSLLLGGGAGLAGAAVWDATHDDTPARSGSPARAARVSDQPDQPAPKGSAEQVAAEVLPSVVKIDVAGPQGQGSGSGIVISEDGEILTNEHVVAAAGEGGQIGVSFDDGTRAVAEVLGTDPLTDTAVIKADDVSGLTPATIGTSGDLDVGQDVVAIGSPFGLDATVTSGIVSALDRPVSVGQDAAGNSTTYPAIQTDAAINPGNSGGPLVDMSGAVVGINASIRTTSTSPVSEGGSIGLGFAIPIDEVMPIVEQIRAGETPTHAQLGVSVSDVPPETAGEMAVEGALLREVTAGSTAEDAGLESGDVVTRVDDTPITSADSLVATIRSYRPGDQVTVSYVRDGEQDETPLVLDSDAE